MQNFKASPNDSRYVPLTQQRMCCVPTCILMIMYRNNIPLISAEELGYYLGLTVPPTEKQLFYNTRVADNPPSESGYGTQIANIDYDPNKAMQELGISLSFSITLADDIRDTDDLLAKLETIEQDDGDALLCFNHGMVMGEYVPFNGHVTVFDRIIDRQIRLIDPSPNQPKWRMIDANVMFEAIKKHGNDNSGGIWHFNKR